MKINLSTSLLFTGFVVILSWVEWLLWTPTWSYLRLLLPLGAGFSFLVAIALLVWGLVRLSKSEAVIALGDYLSLRLFTGRRIINLGPSMLGVLRTGIIAVPFLICLGWLLAFLPALGNPAQAKSYGTGAYLFALIGVLLTQLRLPTRYVWREQSPLAAESTGVYENEGQLIYVYHRMDMVWKRAGALVVLIDQKANFFSLTRHLRRVLTIPIQTPVFTGTLSAVLQPDSSQFPDSMTNEEMTRLECYAVGDTAVNSLLQVAVNNESKSLLETIRATLQVAVGSTRLQEDGVRSLYTQFDKMTTTLEKVDPTIFAEAILAGIRNDIFQSANGPDLFAVQVNIIQLDFTPEFQKVRDTLLQITQQSATANQEIQRILTTEIMAMLPMLMNTSLEEPGKLINQLKDMLTGMTAVEPRSRIQTVSSEIPSTVAPVPQLSEPQLLPTDALRQALSIARKLAPTATNEELSQFAERQLRETGVLTAHHRVGSQVWHQLLTEQAE